MIDGIVSADWYLSLVDDCKAIVTEAVFTSRWELVRGYHALGERIVTDTNFQWNARGNGATLTGLSKSTGINERDLYRAIQFYTKFPVLDAVPEGKNISWTKIITKYLPEKSGAPREVVENVWTFSVFAGGLDELERQGGNFPPDKWERVRPHIEAIRSILKESAE